MSNPRFGIGEVLTRKRECMADWLILQAECLCRFAKEKGSHTALVYAALETRNAIEQLFFTLVIICRPARGITPSELRECKKQGGVVRIFKKFAPDYVKLVEFAQICLSLEPGSPRVIKWDSKRLESYHGKVSQFCHYQGIPSETTEAEYNAWLVKGIALIEEVFNYFEIEMRGAQSGMIAIDSMSPEVKSDWEDFRSGKISSEDLKLRLRIMQPVLRQRKILRHLG